MMSEKNRTVVLIADHPDIDWSWEMRGVSQSDKSTLRRSVGRESISGALYRYSQGVSQEASLQSIYKVVTYTLPDDFTSWSSMNAISIKYRTESATYLNSHVSVHIFESGNMDEITSAQDNTGTEWSTITIDDTQLSDWSAGDVLEIYIKLATRNNYYARVGDITLNYVSGEVDMSKTITREAFNKMWDEISNIGVSPEKALSNAGITVESEPILPGVTPGEWTYCCGHDAENGNYYIHSPESMTPLAEVYSRADQYVMTGSKKLVELVVALFLRDKTIITSNSYSPEAQEIIDQLEKMGADLKGIKDA